MPFAVLFVALSFLSDPFLHTENLLNILDQQSSLLIIAAAGTLVLVAGGIDLSVGATYSLAAVVAATAGQKHSTLYAVMAGLIVGLGVGLLNGVIITVLRINSLIATLAMSFVIGGIGAKVTGGNLIVLTDRPGFGKIAQGVFLGTPSSVWLMLLVVLFLGILLTRTVLGRHFFAAGGNAEAARLAGIRVNQVRIMTFVLSGGAAGLAGIIDASRVLSAQSSQGSALAFTVLAGIVVGGTSIAGGDGSVVRTVIGVLFIALIGNGFDLLGLDPLYQQITLGVILLIAVALDAWSRKQRR
ncbi:ribose transport system permease protein RbsC [mine drainage metagenome]|uniref:Ribose transport system permease protein RbsC n=1 Tax=mine drainage metagenome TaxID=410659 RepID=A0A1J5QRQ1_9ZZZZ